MSRLYSIGSGAAAAIEHTGCDMTERGRQRRPSPRRKPTHGIPSHAMTTTVTTHSGIACVVYGSTAGCEPRCGTWTRYFSRSGQPA